MISARVIRKKGGINHHIKLVKDTENFIKESKIVQKGYKLHLTGMPKVSERMFFFSQKDMSITYPLTFLFVVLVLVLIFRNIPGTVIPFVVILGSVFTTMGTIGFLGWAVNMLNIFLPILMTVIGIGKIRLTKSRVLAFWTKVLPRDASEK